MTEMTTETTTNETSTPTTITLSTKALSRALDMLIPLTRKHALPVLSCVHIETILGGIRVSATDLKTRMRVDLDATVDGWTMDFCVYASELSKLLKGVKATNITLAATHGGTSTTVTAGALTATVKGIDGHEFPLPIYEIAETASCWLGAQDARQALTLTELSAEHTGAREILNSVLVEIVANNITFVACDGMQLSKVLVPSGPRGTGHGVIHVSAVRAILKSLDKKSTDSVSIRFYRSANTKTNYVAVEHGAVLVFSTLIEGNYPDYKQIIPRDSDNVYAVSMSGLMDALAPMKDAETFVIRFSTSVLADLVQYDKVLESMATTVPVDCVSGKGEGYRVALSPSKVYEFAKVSLGAGVGSMAWNLNDDVNGPTVFDGALPSGAMYKYVLMPMYMPK